MRCAITLLRQTSVLMFPTDCVQTQEMPCRLPKILSSKLTSWAVRGKRLLIQTRQVRTFFFLIGSFGPGYLQSWGQSLRFWSLHQSSRLAVSQEWVVSMLVRKHHSVLCLLNRRFLSILMWCWLGLLLSKVCRLGLASQTLWEYKFCNNLRSPDSAAMPFWIWGISIYLGSFDFYEIVVTLPRMKWFYLGIHILWLQSGIFQLSVSILPVEYTWRLLECVIPRKIRSIIGWKSNIIHALSTLVSLNNWVQVIAHETRKTRHGSAETLCKSFLGKSSASRIEREHFHWPLDHHLQAVISLEAI